jgi:hypothetical protein
LARPLVAYASDDKRKPLKPWESLFSLSNVKSLRDELKEILALGVDDVHGELGRRFARLERERVEIVDRHVNEGPARLPLDAGATRSSGDFPSVGLQDRRTHETEGPTGLTLDNNLNGNRGAFGP